MKTIKIDDDSADKLVLDILTEQLLWLKKTPSKHPEDEAWQIELMDGLEKVIRNW